MHLRNPRENISLVKKKHDGGCHNEFSTLWPIVEIAEAKTFYFHKEEQML